MKWIIALTLLLIVPAFAETNMVQVDPNKQITLTYAELQALLRSTAAQAEAAGVIQKVQSQLKESAASPPQP